MSRKPYPSDLSQEEWDFVAPYLTLMKEEAPQREHSLREVFNALRWLARAGAPWRLLPHDFPPWAAVYQQFRRWSEAGCFEALVNRHALHHPSGPRPQRASREQSSWTAAPCSPAVRAVSGQATTATSGAGAARCTWQ